MFLKDLLFPKTCLGCGYLGVYICPRCKNKLVYLEKDLCLYCGRGSFFGLTHPSCRKKLGIDGFLSILRYNNFLKAIIWQMKYRLSSEVWRDFSLTLQPGYLEKLRFYKQLGKAFVLQPIPLHSKKLKERGFNQAKLITNYLKNFLNFSLVDLLLRHKETLSQAKLSSEKDRYLNLKEAFIAKQPKEIYQKNIILVDDVVTTGSTAKEAGRVLKKAGAKEVFVFSIASG